MSEELPITRWVTKPRHERMDDIDVGTLMAILDNAAELLSMKDPNKWTTPERDFMGAVEFLGDEVSAHDYDN